MAEITRGWNNMLMVDGFPRRNRVDLYTPVERAIADAMKAVEASFAHPRMTDAVSLLGKAQEAVADAVEERMPVEQLTTPAPVSPVRDGTTPEPECNDSAISPEMMRLIYEYRNRCYGLGIEREIWRHSPQQQEDFARVTSAEREADNALADLLDCLAGKMGTPERECPTGRDELANAHIIYPLQREVAALKSELAQAKAELNQAMYERDRNARERDKAERERNRLAAQATEGQR